MTEPEETILSDPTAKKVIAEVAVTALTPAAEELGKGLKTVAKALNAVLSPVEMVVWGYEKTRGFVESSVAKKLSNIPIENIKTPPAHIAVPLIESLRYTGELEELRELFANLLATSINCDTQEIAHPAFVEVVRQLSIDEARIIITISREAELPFLCEAIYEEDDERYDVHSSYESLHPKFYELCEKANVQNINQFKIYLGNLQRLKILEVRQARYNQLEKKGLEYQERFYDNSGPYELTNSRYEALYLTDFGQQFITACVDEKIN